MKRIAALAVAALMLVAPASADAPRQSYTIPHVLRFTGAEDIHTLNPHLDTQLVLFYLSSMTMAWLYKTGPHNEPVPELLTVLPTKTNGLISPDGKTVTWKLRHGVKWSDGVPFDADDVVFSIKVVLNPKNNEVGRDGWDLIEKIDEPDKYTVRLHLKKPYSPMPVTFFASAGANPCVLPKHLLDKYETINDVPYNSLPVGIGPFRYKAFDRADKVELEANPYYFRGMPKLKEVIYKIIPDRNTVTTQLQTHELDLWALVTANFYDRIKAFSGITVVREPSYQFDHMDFNLTHADVADPAVREALRYALNREEIRVKIRHGLGALSENVFPPNHQAYHAIPLVPFDLAKARKILDDAGWKPGPDGIRQKNGVRLMLDFASPTGTPDTDSELELIRQNWKKIGVDFTVHHFLSSLFFAPASDGGILYGGKFDAIMFAWSTDSFGDLSTIYGCESFPPNGENAAHWCDHTAQAAMDQFKVEYDPAKRNPYDWIVTDRIVKDVPTIVMDTRENIFAYNSDLKNWHPNATAPFDDMMNVDI